MLVSRGQTCLHFAVYFFRESLKLVYPEEVDCNVYEKRWCKMQVQSAKCKVQTRLLPRSHRYRGISLSWKCKIQYSLINLWNSLKVNSPWVHFLWISLLTWLLILNGLIESNYLYIILAFLSEKKKKIGFYVEETKQVTVCSLLIHRPKVRFLVTLNHRKQRVQSLLSIATSLAEFVGRFYILH